MKNNFQYRIYYEDTDSGGVVYYANYLKFFERARTDFLRELGISQIKLAKEEDVIFVVRKANIEYLSPARLDDLIDVSVEIKEVGFASIIMTQKITKSNSALSYLEVEIACVGASDFKVKKIPQDTKNALNV